MQAVVRSSFTAGVALVGAGAIALAPIAPSLPDISVKAQHGAYSLAAATSHITPNALLAASQEQVLPTGASVGGAIATLIGGGSAALNQSLASTNLAISQGLTGLGTVTGTALGGVVAQNQILTATGLLALQTVSANPLDPASYLTALAYLVNGGSSSLNQSLATLNLEIGQSLTTVGAVTDTALGGAVAVNQILTAAFLTAWGQLTGSVATTATALAEVAAPALPGPANFAAALATLVQGGSAAFSQNLATMNLRISQSLATVGQVTSTALGGAVAINNILTAASLAAFGAIGADPINSASYAAAAAALIGGGSAAVNQGLASTNLGISQGLSTLGAVIDTSLGGTVAVNKILTQSFLTAWADVTGGVPAVSAALALPGTPDFAGALATLIQGGSDALNQSLASTNLGISQGLTTIGQVTNTSLGGAVAVNNILTQAALTAGGAVIAHPLNPASYALAAATLIQGGSSALNQDLASTNLAIRQGLTGLATITNTTLGGVVAVNKIVTDSGLAALGQLTGAPAQAATPQTAKLIAKEDRIASLPAATDISTKSTKTVTLSTKPRPKPLAKAVESVTTAVTDVVNVPTKKAGKTDADTAKATKADKADKAESSVSKSDVKEKKAARTAKKESAKASTSDSSNASEGASSEK
ncbi:hypothetical protein BH09ACT7_BH09ACT7_48150 [soil metagenome]